MPNEIFRPKPTEVLWPDPSISGIIMCGGLGLRAKDLTGDRLSKHLLPTSYTTAILDNPIEMMRQAGIYEIWLLVSEQSHLPIVRRYRKDNQGIRYFTNNIPHAGATEVVKQFNDQYPIRQPIIKADGDEVNTGVDLKDMIKIHNQTGAAITYLVTGNSHGGKYLVDVSPVDRRITQATLTADGTVLYKQNHQPLFLTGLFIMNPEALPVWFNSKNTLDFLQNAIKLRYLYGYVSGGQSVNVNSPKEYNYLIKR